MPLRSTSAKRYAEAVAGLARQDGSWERWRHDLSSLVELTANRPLTLSLQSDRVPAERKRELLTSLLGDRVTPAARSLLSVMARRRRLELLPDLRSWFDELADQAEGVQRVTVTTPQPLTDEQREALRRRVSAGRGQVLLTEQVDPAIIGGLILQQGDIIQDYSIRARLESLRHRMN